MKNLFFILLISLSLTASASPLSDLPLTQKTVKVSEHVWAIIGWPNVGFIVGKNATLVVDTGLGKKNGATVAAVAKKLAPKNRIYLTTTHFHPEHAGGLQGFPKETILIRSQVQQDEMVAHGEEMISLFREMNKNWKEFLTGTKLRDPDIIFNREIKLDLGGVIARIFWFGGAHTKGDQLIFVDGDKTLISGDVVQNKVAPSIFREGGTALSWISVVDEIEKLGALHVLPTHSAIGDGSLVTEEKSFLTKLHARALALKKEGDSPEKAAEKLNAEFRKEFPEWEIQDVTGFVKASY